MAEPHRTVGMKRTWMKGHLDRLPGVDASTGHWPRLTGNCHQHLQRRRHGNRQQIRNTDKDNYMYNNHSQELTSLSQHAKTSN